MEDEEGKWEDGDGESRDDGGGGPAGGVGGGEGVGDEENAGNTERDAEGVEADQTFSD